MSVRKRDGEDKTSTIEWVPRPAGVDGLEPPAHQPLSPKAQILLFTLGVLFPAVVIGVEATQRLCAEAFFDPLPTLGHVLLVSLVPLVNLAGLFALSRRSADAGLQAPSWLIHLLPLVMGVGLAVGAFYSLLFLPLLPVAVVAVLFFGLGLLPFGPVAGFLSLLWVRARLKRQSGVVQSSPRLLAAGVVLGAVALTGLDLPAAMTRLGLQMAVSPDAAERERGLSLLRSFGDRDELLRLAYDTGGRTGGPLSLLIGLGGESLLDPDRRVQVHTPADVREVFYRAYGMPFNALPPPFTGRQWARFGDFAFDADHGGAAVGGRIKGLSLVSSRIDASLSGDDAVGYLEWVLEFENRSGLDREARMTLALPPGGVVSRATLWVNGEEREAAYGGRAEVRQAYEQVAVQQRRDPLLVTTKGADRVLAQAFPVPQGGTLKFKIGITAPLGLASAETAGLVLPAIFDRNFSIGEDVTHAVWIEAPSALSSGLATLRPGRAGPQTFRLDGVVADKVLAARRPEITVVRDPSAMRQVAQLEGGPAIQQTIGPPATAGGRDLVLVVDGSQRMADHAAGLRAALDRLSDEARVGLVIAAEPMVRLEPAAFSGPHRQAVLTALQEHVFAGGQDNTPALTEGLKITDANPEARLLWVHGPQPVRFLKTAALLDQASIRISRRIGVDLYAVEPGPNELLADAPWAWEAQLVPSHGDIAADLSRYMAGISGDWPGLRAVREPVAATGTTVSPYGSQHLARLWARDKVLDLLNADPEGNRGRAVELASAHRLVTPVSGAVVLETRAQYEANGLAPAALGSVPTVPEPHEWALMLLAGAMLLHTLARRRGEWSAAA